MKKRILSLIFCFLLCLALLPMAAFAVTPLTELHFTGSTTSVTAGKLQAFEVNSADGAYVKVQAYGANTHWLKHPVNQSWQGFGGDTPIAVNDGSTHYALCLSVGVNDGYCITEDTKIYYNGKTVPDAIMSVSSWGAYVVIDLGTAKGDNNTKTYAVTFEMNGHGSQWDPQSIAAGEKLVRTNPPEASDARFEGWYKDSACTEPFSFDMPINSDITLYAKWIEKTPVEQLHFTGNTTSVTAGNLQAFEVNTTDGAYVKVQAYGPNTHWMKQPANQSWQGFGGQTPIAVNDGITRYALMLSVGVNDGYCITEDTKIYYNGKEVPDAIFSVAIWGAYVMIDLGTACEQSTVSYTVSFACGDHGSGSMPSAAVQNGQLFTLPENGYTPEAGYEFVYWNTGAGNYKHPGETVTVNADKTVTAMWKKSTYSVTVTTDGHGYAGANTVSGAMGKEVTLSAKANNGYHFKQWQVLKGGITVTDNAFTIGTSDVEIKAIFEQDTAPAVLPFTDITQADWSYQDIAYVYENGLMKGTSETAFSPKLSTSRSMIVTILWRLEKEPAVNYAMSFDDVASGLWYTEAIRWAQSNGIVNGYSAEKFGPNDPITREQMASIFYRYASFKGYDVSKRAELSGFEDAGKIGSWAQDAIAWANANGLVNGVTSTRIDPQGRATREQVAAILHRFCENIIK